ncbi:MAG: tetratricopeptide repeat protein [Pirellulales bacterium]
MEGGLGRDVKLSAAVGAAVKKLSTALTDQPIVEARLRATIAQTYVHLGRADLGYDEIRKALEILKARLAADDPLVLRGEFWLAVCAMESGRNVEALELQERTFATQRRLLGDDHLDTLKNTRLTANLYAAANRHDEALALREKTLQAFRKRFGEDDLETIAAKNNLGTSYFQSGRFDDALKLFEAAEATLKTRYGAEHPSTLTLSNNTAACLERLNRAADAVAIYGASIARGCACWAASITIRS